MRTPWDAMLRTGLVLGLEPDRFWRLSLKEWRMLTVRPEGRAPMGRGELERLKETWPDE
jgi:uncharacterized phage protein (TIGR02216 family)